MKAKIPAVKEKNMQLVLGIYENYYQKMHQKTAKLITERNNFLGSAEGGPFCFEKQWYGGVFDAYRLPAS